MEIDEDLIGEIAAWVLERLGDPDGRTLEVVSEELKATLKQRPAPVVDEAARRVVVTANGRDSSGIVARLSTAIFEYGGDIRDLSQTIVGDYFTMIFVVDIPGATAGGAKLAQLRHHLKEIGGELGLHVVTMHDDILTAMHSI